MKYIFSLFTISLLLAGCSGKTAGDYMKEADEQLNQNKIPEALAAYETVVTEFPESAQAPEAMYQMAAIYQNNMLENVTRVESQKKAVEIFHNVYEKYPESERAPMSLFLSGFIQANELGEYNEATATYNLFLEKYPEHELASSAKEELEYMGLSPEEILKNKSQTDI